jgi:hypothetical protein
LALSTAHTFAAPAWVLATFKLFEKALAESKARIGRGIAAYCAIKPRATKRAINPGGKAKVAA